MDLRINVTGNAGAGKSTAAQALGAALDLPVVNLDSIVWQSGWRKAPEAQRRAQELEIANRPSWIVDGVSELIRERANVIVFLDVPRRVAFWRTSLRNARYLVRSRPGLPSGCPEILAIPLLARIIWRFPRHVRPAILRDIQPRRGLAYGVRVQSEQELSEVVRTCCGLTGRCC